MGNTASGMGGGPSGMDNRTAGMGGSHGMHGPPGNPAVTQGHSVGHPGTRGGYNTGAVSTSSGTGYGQLSTTDQVSRITYTIFDVIISQERQSNIRVNGELFTNAFVQTAFVKLA